ncbi:13064_t:CDS:1, partial [Acaulospora colombiana]
DVFTNQERKLGDRRRSDTVVVLTINYADFGSDNEMTCSSFK